MNIVTLTRDEQNRDGTFGRMRLLSGVIIRTCEDDWLQNARGRSCIPAGMYQLVRTTYWKHNVETFEVVPVPGRTRILVHVGNTEEDTLGCILTGLRRGEIMVAKDEDTGQPKVMKQAVVESRQAFKLFMQSMAGVDRVPFRVEWAPGLPRDVAA